MVLLILLLAGAAAAQTREPGPLPAYQVKRAAGRIAVDGRLDEADWKQAPALTLLFPWEQQTGARQRTAVRLLWNAEALYAGYDCDDLDIVAHFEKRDDPTYRDDAVEFFINPDPSQDFYYGLEMNARAVLYDYFRAFPRVGIKRLDFTGVQLATHLRGTLNVTSDRDQGWTLELAIPWHNFQELARRLPPEPGTEWRANLNRWDGTEPNRRLSLWSDSATERPSPHNPARFGRLVFAE